MEKQKLIAQGAEAKIYLVSNFKTSPVTLNPVRVGEQHADSDEREKGDTSVDSSQKFIQKSRVPKSYRHPKLDTRIRKTRTKGEAKILTKSLEAEVNVPKVLNKSEFELQIEYLPGEKLSETLNDYEEKKQFEIMKKLGEQTAKLHDSDIIHGDLTTSNTILRDEKIYLIDFGLGFFSKKVEDKAVDLHLIKQALEAKHFQNYENLFKNFLKGYKSKDKEEILERLKAVEKRGRYKH